MNRRNFLRSLAIASAALYLRLKPEAVAEVRAVTRDMDAITAGYWFHLEFRHTESWEWFPYDSLDVKISLPPNIGWENFRIRTERIA